MKHLFSPEGDAALVAAMARRPLLAFDFDGTLAPIVARPDDAHVPPAVARRLEILARLLPVAIVTGRKVDDVRARLAFEPRFIIGNHGAEDPAATEPGVDASVFDDLRARLRECHEALDAAGVVVEDKHYSIALHYRLARDRKRALDSITNLIRDLGPEVAVFGGKMVANVVSAQAPSKAHALVRLIARSGATSAFFVGDDINDEPIFEHADASWLTVRIGRDDASSRARFCLDHSGEVAPMLDRMLTLLRDQSGLTPARC